MNVNEAFEYFHLTLVGTMDVHCPKKEYNISQEKIIRDPWITKGLINSIKKQNKLYLKQLHSTDPDSVSRYITYRNVLKK